MSKRHDVAENFTLVISLVTQRMAFHNLGPNIKSFALPSPIQVHGSRATWHHKALFIFLKILAVQDLQSTFIYYLIWPSCQLCKITLCLQMSIWWLRRNLNVYSRSWANQWQSRLKPNSSANVPIVTMLLITTLIHSHHIHGYLATIRGSRLLHKLHGIAEKGKNLAPRGWIQQHTQWHESNILNRREFSLPPHSARGGNRSTMDCLPFWWETPSYSWVILMSKRCPDRLLWKWSPSLQVRMANKLPCEAQGFSSSSPPGLCRHASYQKYNFQMPASTGMGVFALSRCWTPCGRGKKDWADCARGVVFTGI